MKRRATTPPLALLFFLFVLAAPAAQTVWLSSLDLTKMRQGWGAPQVDRSIRETPLAIAGHKFEHGVGTHASSQLSIDLGGSTEKFLASVGVDDAAGSPKASVTFTVMADGRKLWDSGLMKQGDAAKTIDLELKGVKTLLLLVGDGGDGIDFDHADWADARFVLTGAPPKAIDAPREQGVILTPPPPPAPRINGPRIFGARPGSPFLFTIPATGVRPMSFAVDKLPKGLQLDASSGRITGITPAAGTYTLTFRARNARGSDHRNFRLVSGNTLALTPHMGWNSWYVWEAHVTDQIMRDAALAMATNGMRDHGYQYVNIDDCWMTQPNHPQPRDAAGRVLGNERFPDMKGLADYIHSLGLKAGLYTSPGPTTCAGYTGAWEHEAQDLQQFVDWGYDFLKYDWCSYGGIAKGQSLEELQKPYRLMSGLIRQQKRDVVLNFCQYGMGDVWKWGKEVGGNSWRTAGDLGGSFEGIPQAIFRDGFDVYSRNELHKYAGPGGWNDPDYLLMGYLSNWRGQTVPSPLSPNEHYTQFSLWCLVAAPLILSGDITRLDPFTLNVLCNDEVIAVDQDPLGKPGRRRAKQDDLEVWARDLEDGSTAVGLFNRGEAEAPVTARWQDLGIRGRKQVRDLWRQRDLGAFESEFQTPVPRHGVVLVKVSPQQ